MNQTVLEEQIAVALSTDPRYPSISPVYQAIRRPFASTLTQVLQDKMDMSVTFEEFVRVKSAFLHRFAQSNLPKPFSEAGGRTLIERCAKEAADLDQLTGKVGVPRFLNEMNVSAIDMMTTQARPPLAPELQEALDSRSLTFHRLVTTQPGAFLPFP